MQRFIATRPKLAFREAADLEYRIIHRIADSLVPSLRRAFLSALDTLRKAIGIRALAQAFEQSQDAAVGAVPLEHFASALRPPTQTIIEQVADRTARALVRRDAELALRFDITNPRAIAWIRAHAAELVTHVTEDTRAGLREIVLQMFERGIPPNQAARLIKQQIGLLPNHAKAVANLRTRLVKDGVAAPRIERQVARYTDQLLTWRAKMIARTETIRASSEGQRELWDQAVEQGLIPKDARRRWVVTPDDRLCD